LTTGVNACICYFGGITYCVVPHYETRVYTAPSTTTPGTDNTVWWPVTRTTNADDWVSGKIYCPGGPYCNTNLNARTVWLGCYAEGTSYTFYIGGQSPGVYGGLLASPVAGPSWDVSGTVHEYNGISTAVTDGDVVISGAPPAVSRAARFGTKDPAGTNIVMSFTDYTSSPGYTSWQAAMSPFTGDWNFSSNALSYSYTGYTLTGQYTNHKFGSSAAQPFVLMATKMGLSSVGDDGIVITYGTAPPTSGAAAKGWIVYNSNPSAGGTVGWVCTTAGTNGSTAVWKTFGTIAA
jgi:hypothetical protein